MRNLIRRLGLAFASATVLGSSSLAQAQPYAPTLVANNPPKSQTSKVPEATVVAISPTFTWNGVTVSTTGRLFVSMQRDFDDSKTPSVGEILSNGQISPFPGGHWNSYKYGNSGEDQFIGINSVVSDAKDQLWVVDPAGIGGKPMKGKAKLVHIDIASKKVVRVYRFDTTVVPEGGFINDVRVGDGYAYLPDSSLGALIVVNLETGAARRVLANDPRLRSDRTLKLTVSGKPYLNVNGQLPNGNMSVNPVELSTDGRYFYFQPSGGPTLMRIETRLLKDFTTPESVLSKAIESMGRGPFNAGMSMAPDGSIYFSDIELGGISRRFPDGHFEVVARGPASILVWPDASRIGPDGYLYFPSSQINRFAGNSTTGKSELQFPFHLFKVKIQAP
jgi:sugar lactone lactonase YvrE